MAMKYKTYDLVKQLLIDNPECRDSDKKLRWSVWDTLDLTDSGVLITKSSYMKAPNDETIRRCRQAIQAKHPELQSGKWIRKQREEIERQRGTHIFRETVQEVMI